MLHMFFYLLCKKVPPLLIPHKLQKLFFQYLYLIP